MPGPTNIPVDPNTPVDQQVGPLRIRLPAGAVQRPTALSLDDEPITDPLPTDYRLRSGFHLRHVEPPGSVPAPAEAGVSPAGRAGSPRSQAGPAFEFRAAGTITFPYTAPADLPSDTLEVRLLAPRDGLWVPVPAQFDHAARTATVTLWATGTYALVANAGRVPLPPVEAVLGPQGGSLAYARLRVTVPPGCFPEPARVRIEPPAKPQWQGALPLPFQITATTVAGGTPIHDLPVPMALELPYQDAELGELPEGSLAVRTLDATTGFWERLPGTVDTVNRLIRAQTSHLSVFSAGAGSSVDNPFDFGVNWTKTDPFTGNVAVGIPFELPPAPGGLVPDLKLVYSSQASHGAQRADRLDNSTGKQSASWVGEGFQIPLGAVQRSVDTLDNEHFSLEIFGQSFRLLLDASGAWRTEDEQFWKIDRDGTEGTVSFKWRVIRPDGTKYYFGIDAGQLDQAVYYDFATSSQKVRSWMLSRVQDPHGNLVRIDWRRLTKNLNCGGQTGSMTPSVYPKTIQYGGQDWANLPVSLSFVRSSGTDNDIVGQTSTDRVDGGGAWATDGCAQSVFDVKYLDRLEVRVSGTLARVYKFGLAHWANPMWLEEVWLQSDVAGTNKQLLLKTAWTEPALMDTDDIVGGGTDGPNPYRLLASLQNGFGATWSFTYQFAQAASHRDYNGPSNTLFEGRVCRATQESVSPGFGGTAVVTDHLSYQNPLGNNNANWPEFRGHSQVTVRQAGFDTVMDFLQDARKGRPTSIVNKDTAGTTVKTVTNTWGSEVVNGGGTFVRLDRTDEIMGTTTPRTTRTFSYDAAKQGGAQYGNQTDVREWGSADPATGQWYRHTVTEFRPKNQTSPSVVHIVSRPARTRVFANNGSNQDGDWQSEAWHCYDGNRTWDAQPGSQGLLTLVRRRLDGGSPPDDRLADVAYAYDAWGNRTTITEYGDYGSVASPSTVPGDGRTAAFVLDTTLHTYRVSETNALSQQTQYVYDTTKNRLTRVTDPNGAVTAHGYDALGRRTATWLPGDAEANPGAATVTYRYAVGGKQPTRIQVGRRKDAGGGTTGRRAFEWQVYDGLRRLIQRQADFDRSTQVIRASDVNDLRQKLIDYGETFSFGPVVARVDPVRASHYTELRTKVQNRWSTADALLGPLPQWSSHMTPAGPTPGPATPVFGSDLVDLRAWVKLYESASNRPITAWANPAGQVVVVNRQYDNRGLLTRETVPHLVTLDTPGWFDASDWGSASTPATTYTYEALKRPSRRTNPDGTFGEWTYSGWDTHEIDENRHKRIFSHDAFSRLLTVQELTGTEPWTVDATTTYAYNRLDQLTGVTDAVGNATSVTYDKLGRKLSLADPDLGNWSYAYAKAFGDVTSQTDAKGQVLDFVYDLLHRLTQRKQGTTVLAEFVYDEVTGPFAGYNGAGRRTTMKYGAALANTMKYFYDGRGRATRTEHLLGGTTYTRQSTYDELDRVATITHPNNESVAYAYGDHGQPVSLGSSRWGPLVKSAAYNALFRPTSMALNNGVTPAYQYWGVEYRPAGNPNGHFGHMRSVIAGTLQNLTYDYDAKNNVSQLGDAIVGETLSFAYDHLDRLTSAASALFNESYSYTKIGTFGSKGGVSYTYPAAGQPRPHAPTAVGGSTYTYDNDGNLSTAEGRTYTHDVENRLTGLSGDVTKTFAYDGDGVLRTMTEGGVTTRYVFGDYRVNASTNEAFVYYRFVGRAVAWSGNSFLNYLLADHLASSHGEANASGAQVGQRRNRPFGTDRPVSGASDLTVDERFTAQRRLDTGGGNANRELYHYGARWYLPGVGIFTQPDVVVPDPRNPQALNRFAYVFNNPLRYVDPSGRDPLDEAWQAEFEAAHGGQTPTEQDQLDRVASYAVAETTGQGWGREQWEAYTQVKERTEPGEGGLRDPYGLLRGTEGTPGERVKIASAFVMLQTTGSWEIYGSFVGGGGVAQFGGSPFGVPRDPQFSMGWLNRVYLSESLKDERAEGLAATLAHEIFHAELPPRYPFSIEEEARAFAQQARAWEGLRASYRVTLEYAERFAEYQKVPPAGSSPQGFLRYAESVYGRTPWYGR